MAKVLSLTTKLPDLKDARDKVGRKHENLVGRIQTETKSSEKHITVERDNTLSRYHGVLRSVRGIVRAADECNTRHPNTLAQLRLFFKERCEGQRSLFTGWSV